MRRFVCLVVTLLIISGTPCLYAQSTGSGWNPATGPQNAWVYIVFSGYSSMEPKIKQAAQAFGPQASGSIAMIPAQLKQMLSTSTGTPLPENALDLSRPFALVINNPMAGSKPAMVIPVKKDADLPASVKAVHNYVVGSDNQMIATQLTSVLEAAGANAIAAPSGLAHIYVNANLIYSAFGPFLQLMVSQQLSQQNLGPEARIGSAAVNMFFSLFSDLEDLRIALDLTDEAITTTTTVNAKAGSSLASFCADQGGGTSLGGLIPSDGFIAMNGKVKGLPTIMFNITDKVLASMTTNPDEIAPFRESLSKLMGSFGDEFAVNEKLTPDGLVVDAIAGFTGDLSQVRSMFKLMSSDNLPAAFKQFTDQLSGLGGYSYDITESARIAQGVSVDKFSSQINEKELDPQMSAMLKKMWGGATLSGEYAVKDGKLFMCSGGKDYSKRLDNLLVKAGTSTAAESAPMSFSIDLLKLMAFAMQMQGQDMPQMPAGTASPITGTVTFSGSSMVKNVDLPLNMFLPLMMAGQQAQQMAPVQPQNK